MSPEMEETAKICACQVGGHPIIFGRLHVLFYEYDRINYQHQYYYFRVCSNKYYYLLKKKNHQH